MTTDQQDAGADLAKLNANLERVEELTQRLVNAISHKRPIDPALQGPGQELFMKAAAAYVAEMMANPSKLMEHQISFWGKSLKHYMDAQQQVLRGKLTAPPEDPTPKDRRFANPLWDTHPYFNYVKQQYLLSAEAIENAVRDLDHLDPKDRRRVEYFSRQIVDMFSPTNFLGTNPEALARAVATDGQSLVDGLENLVRDLEANGGDLVVTLADREAFKVGTNIATTEGSVVFRNHMFELIQYKPTTDEVHARPLLIFPPWINKFYVLDLKPANSLVKWIVDQGFTLFVVSWKNPDASYRDTGMADYVQDGYLTAIDQVRAITGQEQVNVTGYCIGGTTLALSLAMMKARGIDPVASATFFTTLTDFSDQGEMTVFLNGDFVDGIEREVKVTGVLDKFFMARTFSFLRSHDLIYTPAIRSYMMGDAPPAFALLFWNGDGTNLPARMAVEYLRGLCQDDLFATDGFPMAGEVLRLADVTVPVCAIACETDHIAAWKSSYAGVRKMGSADKTFILSESGHIAGIVNPPGKKKYGHYTNAAWPWTPEEWQGTATYTEGSWWPRWAEWLAARSGGKVPARAPGGPSHPVLCAAPGTYVGETPAGPAAG